MESKGLRIFDKKNEIERLRLSDFLQEIHDGNAFYWSILFLDVIGNLGEDISVPEFEKQILTSERGFFFNGMILIF